MIKKSLIIGMMSISFLGMSQTQCNGLTKDSVQCRNVIKDVSSLCHLHNPNYVSKVDIEAVICSGTTKKNKPCKGRTKDVSGRCHHHRD